MSVIPAGIVHVKQYYPETHFVLTVAEFSPHSSNTPK